MAYANPLETPELYDVIYVAGIASPGVCEVMGAARPYKWDMKDGPGVQGAKITYRGDRPSQFKVKFRLWLQEHFDAWETFRPLFKHDGSKKNVKPVDVLHPYLSDLDILSVVTEEMGQLIHEGKNLWSVTVSLLEYRPPKARGVTSTPNSSVQAKPGGPGAPDAPTAQSAEDKEIAALLAQAQAP